MGFTVLPALRDMSVFRQHQLATGLDLAMTQELILTMPNFPQIGVDPVRCCLLL
jgi:hypothetical protein